MHLRVATGEQRSITIRNVHLGVERARREVNRLRSTHHFAFDLSARVLRNLQIGAQARMNRIGVDFRDAHVNTQGAGLRQIKKLLRRATVPRVNECADVHVAARDHAGKRCVNVLEGFHLLQAVHVGFGGLHDGFFGRKIAGSVVDFLLGHAVGFQKFGVA